MLAGCSFLCAVPMSLQFVASYHVLALLFCLPGVHLCFAVTCLCVCLSYVFGGLYLHSLIRFTNSWMWGAGRS